MCIGWKDAYRCIVNYAYVNNVHRESLGTSIAERINVAYRVVIVRLKEFPSCTHNYHRDRHIYILILDSRKLPAIALVLIRISTKIG